MRLFNSYTLKKSDVSFGNVSINGRIFITNRGKLMIGNNFSANSGRNHNPIGGDNVLRLIVYKPEAVLKIGENVGASNCTIICWNKIIIGNNVIIGGGVKIWDTNFHSLQARIRTSGNDTDIKTAPIYIGDHVFIGGSSIILKGVTIGENSVIAAGSVVTKSIPANVIAGGNPCRVIKNISEM
jgi:acetyltransferase-like isoleucine patch superfamily enzyme